MSDKRIAWLAALAVCAIGVTACAATTSTAPQPTPPASSVVVMPKGDLPVVQATTSSAGTTSAPAPPPGVPNPPPPPGVPAPPTSTDLLVVPPNQPVIPTDQLRLPSNLRPSRLAPTTAAPATAVPTCKPGVSPAPSIREVYPAQGAIGGGTDVMLIGSNLNLGPGTVVLFGTVTAIPYSVTDTTVSVIAPAGSAGSVTVRLQHGGGCNATGQFTYIGPPSPPTVPTANGPATNGPCTNGGSTPRVTGLTPRQLNTYGGESVRITGQGFPTTPGQVAVLFGTTPVPITSVSATAITVTSPPGAPGPLTINVAIPQGCTAYAGADVKYIVPKPVITSISPNTGPKAGGTVVTVTGKYLSNATGKVASKQATVTGVADTTLTVVVPQFANTGQAAFSVTTPGGGTGVLFTYTP